MDFFSRVRALFVGKVLSKISWFSQKEDHSLSFLNAAQFLGVVNDNVFKLALAFLLIDAQGKEFAPRILSAAGAIYVIPFLLFSSSAGILADRFSKQRLLVFMKGAEILIMTLALFAFSLKIGWVCYSLLFLLSTHSAMFGPSKYGIIPELVPSHAIPRANGLITSFTYLAIIIGTFLASFLTEITDRRFVIVAAFCWVAAFFGFLSSFGIKRTQPQGSDKKINLLFVREIYHTLCFCKTKQNLLPAIFGSAYFLFIGAFTQLNIIPFALQSLHLSEIAGGYLFLSTAIGIVFGSYAIGKFYRKKLGLGISCLAGFGLSALFFLLWAFSSDLKTVVLFLVSIGLLGGVFIVPFDSFIQIHSPDEKRGQVIAAANFLSFAGVLLASFALFLFSQVFAFTSASGFALVGGITALVSIALSIRLSDMTLPALSKQLLFPLFRFSPPTHMPPPGPASLLLLPKATWKQAVLLKGVFPNAHFYISCRHRRCHPWLHSLFPWIHVLKEEPNAQMLSEISKQSADKDQLPCLLLEASTPQDVEKKPWQLLDFFKLKGGATFVVDFQEKSSTTPYTLTLTSYRKPLGL